MVYKLDEICEESTNMVIYDAIDWAISHKSLLLTSKDVKFN